MTKMFLNEYPIEVEDLQIDQDPQKNATIIRTTFQVTHADYHDVTTLLYKNDFLVDIPAQGIKMRAIIQNYSTSIDDLYKGGATGTFYLELIEQTA